MAHILAIETSCDDTSVALVDQNRQVKSVVVSSQVKDHEPYNGVVPEIASRAHLRNLPYAVERCFAEAEMDWDAIEAIAVTQGPGLIGSLLVGINFAKGLAMAKALPLIAVNHIRGHMAAPELEFFNIPYPRLCLIVSGGHTHLFHQTQNEIQLLAKTADDAAGEAFDKLAKMLELGFPGGPVIDRLAENGDPKAFQFNKSKFSDGFLHFSYSGFKTQALRFIEKNPAQFRDEQVVADLCASFRHSVVQHLLERVEIAQQRFPAAALLLGGGVACNRLLRKNFQDYGSSIQVPTFISKPLYCTDNAAMIGAEAWRLHEKGMHADMSISAEVSMPAWDKINLMKK